MLLKAVSYWLDRYGLVFSDNGKVTGASYTDVNASLPARTFLFYIAVIIAIGVLASIWLSSPILPAIAFAVMLIISIVVGGIYPTLIQQIEVKPNAAQKEAKYISRNIQATRAAYGIQTDTAKGGDRALRGLQRHADDRPQRSSATAKYANTIDNIRLLDPDVVVAHVHPGPAVEEPVQLQHRAWTSTATPWARPRRRRTTSSVCANSMPAH